MTTYTVSHDNEAELGCDQVSVPVVKESLKLQSNAMHSPCMYGTKPSLINSTPMSLNSIFGRRTSRKTIFNHPLSDIDKSIGSVSFAKQPQEAVTTNPSEIDYGYGYGYGPGEPGQGSCLSKCESGIKRRRYQRRNSKTAQMLMAMTSSLNTLDFLKGLETNDCDYPVLAGRSKSESDIGDKTNDMTSSLLDDDFDGLAIAEELVLQLQKRLKSHR